MSEQKMNFYISSERIEQFNFLGDCRINSLDSFIQDNEVLFYILVIEVHDGILDFSIINVKQELPSKHNKNPRKIIPPLLPLIDYFDGKNVYQIINTIHVHCHEKEDRSFDKNNSDDTEYNKRNGLE